MRCYGTAQACPTLHGGAIASMNRIGGRPGQDASESIWASYRGNRRFWPENGYAYVSLLITTVYGIGRLF